eukprot:scaffold1042_cov401-Prasinococcus_capsulatus_cf.AAC.44
MTGKMSHTVQDKTPRIDSLPGQEGSYLRATSPNCSCNLELGQTAGEKAAQSRVCMALAIGWAGCSDAKGVQQTGSRSPRNSTEFGVPTQAPLSTGGTYLLLLTACPLKPPT